MDINYIQCQSEARTPASIILNRAEWIEWNSTADSHAKLICACCDVNGHLLFAVVKKNKQKKLFVPKPG